MLLHLLHFGNDLQDILTHAQLMFKHSYSHENPSLKACSLFLINTQSN